MLMRCRDSRTTLPSTYSQLDAFVDSMTRIISVDYFFGCGREDYIIMRIAVVIVTVSNLLGGDAAHIVVVCGGAGRDVV